MTPERWAATERMFREALTYGASERESFLLVACAGDEALRREVESLLAHDGRATFLSTAAAVNDVVLGSRIGQSLGQYVISARMGEGGMGEVYRAHDPILGRDVAIKILPRAVAADPDRLARFDREAHVLASLNHPHIGAIYGVQESDAGRVLVLELVEGETLADALVAKGGRGKGLPVPQALAIASQIADALEAAHERGIIHRDLKPANIKITPAGIVKVLDFGLAKIVAGEASSVDASRTRALIDGGTRDDIILGTAAYMSPEQARGQPVDKRTDIWAFGCVLYETLTGHPAFARESMPETIAAVLVREPDWARLPMTTPSSVVRLLRRCLTKEVTQRQRDMGDVRIELAAGTEMPALEQGRPERSSISGRWKASAIGVAVVALAAVVALGSFVRRGTSSPAPATAIRFSVPPPPGSRFFHNVGTTFLALSADGSQLAFVASTPPGPRRVWVRPISSLEARVVPGTEGATSAFWSPDGRSLAFFAAGKLKRIDLPGGAAVALCDVPRISEFGTWGSEGTILFASGIGDGIFSVSSAGGIPKAIVTPDPARGEGVLWPSFLPDGKRFLYLSQLPNITGQLMLAEPGQPPRSLLSAVSNVEWVDPDYLVFALEDVLVAQRFDQVSGRVIGAPISIAEPVDRFLSTGRSMFTTSRNGTIAYHSYANISRLVWVDRSGKEVGTVGAPGNYMDVRLSPDGTTVLFDRTNPGLGTWDVWTADLARGVETRLTSGPGSEAVPIWSADGRSILFADDQYSTRNLNLARKRLDTGIETPLLPNGLYQRRAIDVSPDGRTLLFMERTAGGTFDILTLPLDGPATPSLLFGSPFNEADPHFSPDGRAMSFTSDESGRFEAYVAPFPPTGGKTLVSDGISIGTEFQGGARWRRDGRELFYMSADGRLMTVPIRTTPTLTVGTATPLFTFQGRTWSDFAVSADATRFLAVVPQSFAGEQPLSVILNWTAEVHR